MSSAPSAAARVLVVGGGISGLSCAVHLARSPAPLHVTLLEASDRLGGVISTLRREGCLLEEGPDAIFTEKPWGVDFCKALGLGPDIIATNPGSRASYILKEGKLYPVPDGFYLIGPAKIGPFLRTPLLSCKGKLRAAAELFLPRRPVAGDESLASFVTRRFGAEVLERIAQPMVGGIYSADPDDLSLAATFPRFLDMEREAGSVILGLRRRVRGAMSARGPRYSLFIALRSGLEGLVEKAAEAIPQAQILRGKKAAALKRCGGGSFSVQGEGFEVQAEAVCLALPAPQAALVLEGFDAALAGDLAAVPYRSGATVNLAYRKRDIPPLPDGFGFVVPRKEGRAITGCTFSSVKFCGRAPQDTALLRVFIGGEGLAQGPLPPEDEIAAAAGRELADILGIACRPLFAHVRRFEGVFPQYRVGHLDRVRGIQEKLRNLPGLALAGNAYEGPGIPDCVESGRKAAQKLLADLGRA